MRAAFVVAWAASLVPAPAFAQAPAGHEGHDGHEAHRAAAAARAPAPSPARVMSPQPVIRDVALVDHQGRATSLRAALDTDAPVLVNFIFTSCTTVCPIMTTGFAQLHERLAGQPGGVRLVSISIDPETDTVETLRGYAARYHAGDSWRFLTGTVAATETAQRAFGAYRGDKSNHAPATYLRRSRDSAWESLEGLSSAQRLFGAYRGDGAAPGS